MSEPLSAQALLEKFKRKHGIVTKKAWAVLYPWRAYRGEDIAVGSTELEAVRALCKTVGLLCEL